MNLNHHLRSNTGYDVVSCVKNLNPLANLSCRDWNSQYAPFPWNHPNGMKVSCLVESLEKICSLLGLTPVV